MTAAVFRRTGAVTVDLVALVAALFDPFSLYVVLLLYWGDLIGGSVRRVCQTVVAAPREEYSPTEPPALTGSGDPNPFRFLTPKLGTVRPVDRLPPIALHNLKPGVLGLLSTSLIVLAVGLTATFLEPPFTVRSWPTVGLLAVGGVAIVAKHGWAVREFVRSDRPPAEEVLPDFRWLATVLMALPVVIVDAAYADAGFDPAAGFAAIASVLVVGRIADEIRRDASSTGADPFVLPEPTGRPIERFRTDRRAVRIAGAIDGLAPRLEWDVLNLQFRLWAVVLLSAGGFVTAYVVGPAVAVIAVGAAFVAVANGFAIAGIAHFESAFGAMEYRLYDDELVAYDTRLEAVQWRAPLDAIRTVTVERGVWTAPPGTDAATVALERTDLAVERSPYGFYRQTLPYVERPERVADRLRRVRRGERGDHPDAP